MSFKTTCLETKPSALASHLQVGAHTRFQNDDKKDQTTAVFVFFCKHALLVCKSYNSRRANYFHHDRLQGQRTAYSLRSKQWD